jgi:branched-chain amino acid transport system substrate-binding protein
LSQIRAAKPDAVFAFFPGGLGVSFVKQYVQAGLLKEVPLYSAFTIDWTNLNAIGEAAVGTFHASFWTAELDNAANKKFVAEYRKKYSAEPDMYAAQGYDAAMLIDSAVKAVKGKVEDQDAFRAALRKADFPSVRGTLKFNNNHFPIQDFHLREVVKGADGKLQVVGRGVILKADKDAYSAECPMKW